MLPKSWPTARSLGLLWPSHSSQWLTTSGSNSNSPQLRIVPGLRSTQTRHAFRAATSAGYSCAILEWSSSNPDHFTDRKTGWPAASIEIAISSRPEPWQVDDQHLLSSRSRSSRAPRSSGTRTGSIRVLVPPRRWRPEGLHRSIDWPWPGALHRVPTVRSPERHLRRVPLQFRDWRATVLRFAGAVVPRGRRSRLRPRVGPL